MRWIKLSLIFLGGLLILCLVFCVVLLASFDNDDYQWLVTRGVELFSDYKVNIQGPFAVELSSEPLITASKARITHTSDPAFPIAEIDRFEIKIALRPLLTGIVLIKHLLIYDATFSVIGRDSEPEEKPSDVLIPVLESVSLQNVLLTVPDGDKSEIVRILLANLSLNDVGDKGPLYVKAAGTLNSKEFKFDGQLGSLANMLNREKPYPVDVRGTVESLSLTMSGTVDDPVRGQGLNIRTSGEHVELADTLRLFWSDVPNIGRMKFEASITGDVASPNISSLDLTISDGSELEFTAKGSITDLRGEQESNIVFSGTCSNKDLVKMFLTEEMPRVSLIKAEGTLRRRQGEYFLENVNLNGSDGHGLLITSSGSLTVRPEASQEHVRNLDLMTKVTAPFLHTAAPYLQKMPVGRLGPVQGEGRITGTSKVLSIDDIGISAGKEDRVHVKCQGRVGKIPLSAGGRVSDIAVISSVKAQNAPSFASLLGISFLDIGPLEGSFRFIAQEGVYGFKNIQLAIGSQESLWLKGDGFFDLVTKDGSVVLGGLDAKVEASAPSLAAVPGADELGLPDLRPLQLKAHITDPDGRIGILDIKEFKFDAGTRKDAFLEIEGGTSAIGSSGQMVLDASFETSSKPWVMKILEGSSPENHVVQGKLKIAGTPKDMRIEELEVGTRGPKRLYIEAGGNVKEIEGTHEIEGKVTLGASDMSVLQSFLGTDVPPFSAPLLEGRMKGNTKKASFEGTIRLGNSRFRTALSHSVTKERPSFKAKIAAQTVHLADLGLYPKESKDLPPEIESKPQAEKRLFGEEPLPFDDLKAIDLSVSVDIDKLIGKNLVLKKLDFDLSLKNGKLQIAPATVEYRKGLASIEFTGDTVGSKPTMALRITAEDVDLGALFAYFHKSPFFSGQLNLVVDLKSSGKSPREIAGALDGELAVAVEEGKIKRVVEFMGADALDFLTAVSSTGEYKDLNCMALRFIFQEGMGKSEMIYLETADMYARGGARIDLNTETMKMVLQPKHKKKLPGLASAVTIEGPIARPKIRKLPFVEAATLYGEIALPVVFLPARALGYLWYLMNKDQEEESPCSGMRPTESDWNGIP